MSLQEVVNNCRNSWILLVLVVSFSHVMDTVTLAFLLPLLPRIMREYYCQDATLNDAHEDATSPSTNVRVSSTNVYNGTRRLDDVTETVNATICDDVTISFRVGLVAGIGPAAEVVLNPIIVYLVSAWGENVVFNVAAALQFLGISSLSVVKREWGLFLGRVSQSVGSTMLVIAGYTMLVSAIDDDSLRARAFSFAYTGLTIGFLMGYSLGGFLYEVFGGHIMFLFLLVPSGIDVLLRLAIPRSSNCNNENTTWKDAVKLLTDPYMIMISLLVFVSYGVPLLIMATLPNYLVDRTAHWQISTLYLIATAIEAFVQLIATKFVQTLEGRFRVFFFGFVCQTIGLVCLGVDWNVWVYLFPIALIRIGEGVTGAMVPSLLAHISDVRLLKPYSAVYAIYCAAFTTALAVSPICGGYLLPHIGFKTLCLCTAGVTFLALLLSLALRNVPVEEETPQEDTDLITK